MQIKITMSYHLMPIRMTCCYLVVKLCRFFCDCMDCSLAGSSVHWISQPRILEWVAISFPRGSSWIRDWTLVSSIGRQIRYRRATREAQATKESQHSVICVWDRTFVSDLSSQLSFVDIWKCIWYGLEYSLGWVTEEQWEEREPRRISISPFLYQSEERRLSARDVAVHLGTF